MRQRRMGHEMALKQSSKLTDDLLTATRMIQQNTDKSARTLDKLSQSLTTYIAKLDNRSINKGSLQCIK